MIYTRGAIEWNVVLPGRGLAGKLAQPGRTVTVKTG